MKYILLFIFKKNIELASTKSKNKFSMCCMVLGHKILSQMFLFSKILVDFCKNGAKLNKIIQLVPQCTNCNSEFSPPIPPRTKRHTVSNRLDSPPPCSQFVVHNNPKKWSLDGAEDISKNSASMPTPNEYIAILLFVAPTTFWELQELWPKRDPVCPNSYHVLCNVLFIQLLNSISIIIFPYPLGTCSNHTVLYLVSSLLLWAANYLSHWTSRCCCYGIAISLGLWSTQY